MTLVKNTRPCNLTEMDLEDIYEHLEKEVTVSPEHANYGRDPYVRLSPLTFVDEYLEVLEKCSEEKTVLNRLAKYKMIAILDQLNIKPHPCRYCQLPYSYANSYYKSNDHTEGTLQALEWRNDKKWACFLCERFDNYYYYPKEIAFFGRSHNPFGAGLHYPEGLDYLKEIGENNGVVVVWFEEEWNTDYVIRNMYPILEANDLVEIQELARPGLVAKTT